jgi:hypothetical protein
MEIAHRLASESERIRLEGGGAKKCEPGTQPAIKENLERSSIFSYLVLFKSNSPQRDAPFILYELDDHQFFEWGRRRMYNKGKSE